MTDITGWYVHIIFLFIVPVVMHVSRRNEGITLTNLPYVRPHAGTHRAAIYVIQLPKTGCNCIAVSENISWGRPNALMVSL